MFATLARWLDHPRAGLAAVVGGVLLSAGSIGAGLGADDWFHRAHLDPEGPYFSSERGPILDLFLFFPAEPGAVRALMDQGVLSWWTQPDIRGGFFRPLTALTHAWDWWGVGAHPALHHLHSLAWLALALWAAHRFFLEWLGPGRRAVLATWLYAVDENHALPASWVANRNALLAMAFGALSARAHLAGARGERGGAWFAAGWLALALLSAEAGVATFAVLAALELGRAEPLRVRARRWVPLALVGAAWAAAWITLGYGMYGSGLYVDPLRDPVRYLSLVPERLGALGAAAWMNLPVDVWAILPPRVTVPLGLGLLVAVSLAVAGLARRAWRSEPVLLQAVVLSTLALLPPTATFPMTRVIGLGGLGVAAVFAVCTAATLDGSAPRWRDRLVLAWHLPVSALVLAVHSALVSVVLSTATAAADALGPEPEIADQTLVLTGGHEIMTAYIPIVRHYDGRPVPKAMVVLGPVGTPVTMTREDERTLRLDAARAAFTHSFERLARAAPFTVGERVDTATLHAEVLAVDAQGNVLSWRVRFPAPLEDPRYAWRRPEGMGFLPFTPPAVGESVAVAAAVELP